MAFKLRPSAATCCDTGFACYRGKACCSGDPCNAAPGSRTLRECCFSKHRLADVMMLITVRSIPTARSERSAAVATFVLLERRAMHARCCY